jgi:DNA-binding GntR family transcriptional regulator
MYRTQLGEDTVPGTPLRRNALTEQIYDLLRERIVDAELAPGQRLNIDALAGELGVSNIPVREALARLAAENLAVQEPYKGYSVMPLLTLERLHQLLDARLLIEPHAGRIAASCLDEPALQTLHDLAVRMETLRVGPSYQEFKAFTVCDHDFHSLIVAGGGNAVLAELYESLSPHIQLSRLYAIRGGVDSDEGAREHRAILQGLLARDPDAVASALTAHIEGARRRLGAAYARGAGAPAKGDAQAV